MSGAWSQLEQLLTCAICLDRFRNPKLLPCQHTFCGEPCMEGLVDYARRQIKCPECRAEHRIPYNGVQSFPHNVTLTRFLDLHRSITGEEPEPLPSQMDRCNVCGEKSYCNICAHCNKKVCDECRTAHLDILRREINRINTQIRRGIEKLSEFSEQSSKGNEKLISITTQIRDEITESVRRLIKDLKDRETKLLEELDEFVVSETKNNGKLSEDFEIELATITSNCDLADEHINEQYEWTDAELMEFKDIYMKTLDFLRNLDTDSMDYSRKIKYVQKVDLDNIRRNIADFGEIRIAPAQSSSSTSNYLSPLSPADSTNNLAITQSSLMRSQSDHRLAQFASPLSVPSSRGQRDPLQRSYLDVTGQNKYGSDTERPSSPPGRQGSVRFGSVHERSSTSRNNNDFGYTRGWQRPGDSEYEPSNSANFRSRFMRERIRERTGGAMSDDHSFDDHDSDILSSHRVRFQEESPSSASANKQQKLFDTEEMANMRAPLSDLIKLMDSPHLMERLHQNEIKAKQKAAEAKETESSATDANTNSVTTTPTNQSTQPVTNVAATNPTPAPRQPARQMSEDEVEKQKKQSQAAFTQQQQQQQQQPTTNTNTATTRTTTATNRSSSDSNTNNNTPATVTNRRIQAIQQEEKRSPSSSDDDLNFDDDATTTTPASRPSSNTSARRRIFASSHSTSAGSNPSNFSQSTDYGGGDTSTRNRYSQPSSYVSNTGNIGSNNSNYQQSSPQQAQQTNSYYNSTPTRSLLSSRYGQQSSQDDSNDGGNNFNRNRRLSKDDNNDLYSSSSVSTITNNQLGRRNSVNRKNYYYDDYLKSNNNNTTSNNDTSINSLDIYGRRTSTTNDRHYGNQQHHGHHHHPHHHGLSSSSSTTSYFRNRLAKSKSSHAVAYEDSDDDSNSTSTMNNPLSPSANSNVFKSRFASYGSSSNSNTNNNDNHEQQRYLSTSGRRTSRSGYTYRTREQSPEEESAGSVTQYLINKYGTRNHKPTALSKSKSSHAIFGRSLSSSDEDAPTTTAATRFRRDSVNDYQPYKSSAAPIGLTYPRQMYLQKKRMMMKIGSRGTNPSCFTWPRGVACGPDNGIVVADSSNHRVQVFDSTGRFLFEFGSYGSGEGEFDCLAGVTVNRIGHFIVSDRYNHRVQVFDASGRFLRAFGSEGRSDGKFSYPWGIATDALGFIYVCDKENHRIQVFQSDGTFVGKFGSIGSRAGLLEHPHYIAVSNTNRIIVSDSNNHRIQIFDINGRSILTFGSEGSGDGQFKFPRGVAVDENGFIIVGDSGNNRIQIFSPDGTFLKTFGQWGSGEGEFKGLEGIAISSTGNILVCDRENHRIQVF